MKIGLDLLIAFFVLVAVRHLFHQRTTLFFQRTLLTIATPGVLWLSILMGAYGICALSRQQFRTFSLTDLPNFIKAFILAVLGITALLLWHPNAFGPQPVIYYVATVYTFHFWILIRLAIRTLCGRTLLLTFKGKPAQQSEAIIVGGGTAGLMIANQIRINPRQFGVQVLGFVDDDPAKQHLEIQGIPVLGNTQDLAWLIPKHQKPLIILAIPSASGRVIRQLSNQIQAAGAQAMTVPGLYRMLNGEVWKPAIKPISIEDILRREPIQLNQSGLSAQLRDAVVLVTGAGGSIGSEICRQLAAFRPKQLILLGRGEGSLWAIEQNLRSLFPDQALTLELCDIRNQRRLRQVFQRWRPQVVFHAAAHKHVPFLEEHPEEAVENNIFGTQHVVQAALSIGTRVFVNISTDKAINPTNVLGASKYLAERLLLQASHDAPPESRYVSVRFGNVLGSRGSVVSIFQDQIAKGGPLTLTHPEMRRYFMTIPEASQLVLQAGLLGGNGKIYVLDMGQPVKIQDLAHDMIRLAGHEPNQDIEVKFTGVRPGEKLYEEVFSGNELECESIHPKVREALPIPLNKERLEQALQHFQTALEARVHSRRQTFLTTFLKLIPGYAPHADGLGKYSQNIERTMA